MPRFYVSAELHSGSTFELPDNVVRHLNVLRVKSDEEIVLFNGNGRTYSARLTLLEKRRAELVRPRKDCPYPVLRRYAYLVSSAANGGRYSQPSRFRRRCSR